MGDREVLLNPPWELLGRVLNKIEEEKTRVLLVAPVWRSAPWWRRILNLLNGPMFIVRNRCIFRGPKGEKLPPPRWGTAFMVVGPCPRQLW